MAQIKSAIFSSYLICIYYAFIIFCSCLVYSNKASEIRRPRGVSISKASLYIPDKDFTCFDGSGRLPFSQVNDDYCDCNDGSDEPGTSACPTAFFHCTNAGFRPLNIPSSQVNDGLCDCCDGSDEYLGQANCVNVCSEMGKAERVEAQRQAEVARIGNEARIQSSKKGKQIKQEKKEKLEQLKKDLEEAEKIKQEKDRLKAEKEELEKEALVKCCKQDKEGEDNPASEERKASEQEAFEVFNLLDSNQDKKLQISEIQVRQTFDQNKDGSVSDEEAKFFLDNTEEIDWGTFVTSGWPKMKPFFMAEKGMFRGPRAADDDDDLDNEEMYEEDGRTDGVGTVQDVTHEYQQERQDGDEEMEEGEEQEEEEEEDEEPLAEETESKTEDKPEYDEETDKLVKAAVQARAEFTEADRALRDIQREISQLEEHVQKDYGTDEEFAPLEGECFEYSDREYLYKLCPFDKASQQPRSGGAETRLGLWGKWNGSEGDKYRSMLYEKGQSCWNGPYRSTQVTVSCGIDNAILSVSEPNKCEYHFHFTTPSACIVPGEGLDERPHDEL